MTFSRYTESFSAPTFMYGSASSALKDYLSHLRDVTPDKSTILLPSYICANVYSAVLALNLDVRCYDVNTQFRTDLGELEAALRDRPLAMLWVHYFGRVQDAEAVRALADAAGVEMIEDCAHTIAGFSGGRRLGTIGHASIFSVWKTLRTTDGGMLVVNRRSTPAFRQHVTNPASESTAVRGWVVRRLRRLIEGARGTPLTRGSERPTPAFGVDVDAARSEGIRQMSRVSAWRLRGVDLDTVVAVRRENYETWSTLVAGYGWMTPVFGQLENGAVPFSYPVRIDARARDAVRQALWTRGILCGAGFPEAPFDARFTDARRLSQTILELPVHQEIGERDLRVAERVLRAWARRAERDIPPPSETTPIKS